MSAPPVVLVSMPFLEADRPSIQLGLLKAVARQHGFPVRTLHANLDFAVRIGLDHYRRLADHRGRQIGDWLFSVAAFGDAAPDPDGKLLDELGDELSYLDGPERLLATREHDVPAYLDAIAEELAGVRVACFSSTFQQNTASFALARRLKERDPTIVTVFGGANLEGEMGLELVRSVGCVDLAVLGEGDVAFPRLLDALATGADPGAIPGVARRVGDDVVAPPAAPRGGADAVAPPPAAPPHERLDELPVPDYGEYFERATRLGLPTEHVALP